MKLTWIEITNFQCFGSATVGIDFENDLTAFVGGNGSGKTAVMRALTRMFGVGSSQRTIRRTDFHIPPEAAGPINGTRLSIDGTFSFPTREPLMELGERRSSARRPHRFPSARNDERHRGRVHL